MYTYVCMYVSEYTEAALGGLRWFKMSIYVYICMYVCMYIYMYIYGFKYIYEYVYEYMYYT
jgi:hypothetical protein